MLKHLQHLSKEVNQLLETIKSKQKDRVIEIRNTEVESLFKQGKFIRFNYGAMYIPRVTITDKISNNSFYINCYHDVSYYKDRYLIGRDESIREYVKTYFYDVHLVDLTIFSHLARREFFISFFNLVKNNYRNLSTTLKTPLYSLIRELKKTKTIHVEIDWEYRLAFSLLITPTSSVKVLHSIFKKHVLKEWFYYRGFARVINLPTQYHHDCLFSIPMSYVKGVEAGLKEINNAIKEQR